MRRGKEGGKKRNTAAKRRARECGKAVPETPVFIDHLGKDSKLGRMHVGSGPGRPGVNPSVQCCFSAAVEPQMLQKPRKCKKTVKCSSHPSSIHSILPQKACGCYR